MLKVEHITTGYGKKQVLTDVLFEAAKGKNRFADKRQQFRQKYGIENHLWSAKIVSAGGKCVF